MSWYNTADEIEEGDFFQEFVALLQAQSFTYNLKIIQREKNNTEGRYVKHVKAVTVANVSIKACSSVS